MGSETEAQRDRGTEEGKIIRQEELGIWRQRIQGFLIQALPLQVPESPERSERLEVFFYSGTLLRGEGLGGARRVPP